MLMKRLSTQIVAVFVVCMAMTCLTGCGNRKLSYASDKTNVIPIEDIDGSFMLVDVRSKDITHMKGTNIRDVSMMHEGRFVVKATDGEGVFYYFADADGDSLFGHYASASFFSEDKAWVADREEHLRVIDRDGKTLFQLDNAEFATAFLDDRAVFYTLSREVGMVNEKGEVLIEPEGLVKVSRLGDKFIASYKRDSISYLVSRDNHAWNEGVMLKDVSEVITNASHYANTMDVEDLFKVNDYLVDMIEDGIMIAKSQDKYGLINDKGKWVTVADYDWIVPDNDLFLVFKDTLCGWIDRDGKQVVPMKFVNGLLFHDRKLTKAVNLDGEWGYIDRRGKWRTDEAAAEGALGEYDWMCTLPYSHAQIVYRNDSIGLLSKKGRTILELNNYGLSDDISYDLMLMSNYAWAHSDYIDIETALAAIEESVLKRSRKFTAKEITDRYENITSDMLMKNNGGEILLSTVNISDTFCVKLYATNINVKTQVYTGWFYRLYDIVYNPNAVINHFRVLITTGGRLQNRWNEIMPILVERLGFDANTLTNSTVNDIFNIKLTSINPDGTFTMEFTPKK